MICSHQGIEYLYNSAHNQIQWRDSRLMSMSRPRRILEHYCRYSALNRLMVRYSMIRHLPRRKRLDSTAPCHRKERLLVPSPLRAVPSPSVCVHPTRKVELRCSRLQIRRTFLRPRLLLRDAKYDEQRRQRLTIRQLIKSFIKKMYVPTCVCPRKYRLSRSATSGVRNK